MVSIASSRPTGQLLSSAPSIKPPTQQPKPSLRRKRDASDDMDSFPDTPSSPSKRHKVSFDPDVEIVTMDDEEWGLDPMVVREEVRRAIQQHLNNQDESYDRLKEIFKKDPNDDRAPSQNVLKIHLQAVLANITLLDKSCNGLVNAILNTEWVRRDTHFISIYTKFLGNLAAAQAGFLSRTFAMLVDVLADTKTRRLPGTRRVRRALMHARAHTAIQYLLQLIPIGSSVLARILSRRLQYDPNPNVLESDIVLTKNALKILQYAPELKADVLSSITSELVKVDVQVQVDLDDLDDDLADDLVFEVSQQSSLKNPSSQVLYAGDSSDESMDSETAYDSDSEDETDAFEVRLKTIKTNIEKVDAIIDLLFQYYDALLQSSFEARENAIELLLSHFHTIILPTYRSRHTQFLIFHFAQTDSLLIDRFATSCIQLIFDTRQPPILRQSAAAYLASFVARGAHVPASVVRDVFDLLCGQLDTMRKDNEPICRGPDLRRYSSFYSMAQALLYIFCFRWKNLTSQAYEEDDLSDLEDDEETTFPHKVRDPLYQAIYSKLNPLRVCSSNIVNEFARVAHHLNFLYVYPKLELNKTVRLSSYRVTMSASTLINQPDRDDGGLGQSTTMESYFPFDPYTLPRSKRWVEDDYVEWEDLTRVGHGDGADESDGEEQDLDSDGDGLLEEDEVTATDEEED